MSVEERHLLNKIRFFEDMLLRSKVCSCHDSKDCELLIEAPLFTDRSCNNVQSFLR